MVYGFPSLTSYSPYQEGIIHGSGGDTILLNGEAATIVVDELLVIGPGFFFDITCSGSLGPPLCDPANPLTAAQQLAMANGMTQSAYGGQSFDFTWNGDFSSSGSFLTPPASGAPEPSGMFGVGVIALMALNRVSRKRKEEVN